MAQKWDLAGISTDTTIFIRRQCATTLPAMSYRRLAEATRSRFTPRSHGKPSGYLSLLSGRGDGPFFRTISLALLAVPHGGARWTPMRFGRFKICHRRVCACSCLKSKRMTGALHLVLTEESTPTLAMEPHFSHCSRQACGSGKDFNEEAMVNIPLWFTRSM